MTLPDNGAQLGEATGVRLLEFENKTKFGADRFVRRILRHTLQHSAARAESRSVAPCTMFFARATESPQGIH